MMIPLLLCCNRPRMQMFMSTTRSERLTELTRRPCGIASHIPGDRVAGLLMKRELDYLTDRVPEKSKTSNGCNYGRIESQYEITRTLLS